MTKCKRIREVMAGDYDTAADKGVSKKLLKVIIAERKDERTIAARRANLEQDEVSEFDMLCEKLGDYANTPLGGAALAKAKGGRPTRKQPKASLPALEWLAAKRYKKVCLGHKKCRPEDWRLTVVPQFRLRCSAMVAITKRGSP